MTKEHVALIGFMGAGKSTVGKRLARQLAVPFVDTDDVVVAVRGRSIAEIFEQEGEAAFREYEFEAARSALDGPPLVVALGGGAVTHPPTRVLLAERATRVYLEMEPLEILMRLRHSQRARPLMGSRPTIERIETLLAAREPLYREAELVVRSNRRHTQAVAREIAALLSALRESRA